MTTARVRTIIRGVLIAGLLVGVGGYFVSRWHRAQRMEASAARLREIGEQMRRYADQERRGVFPRTTYPGFALAPALSAAATRPTTTPSAAPAAATRPDAP